jgi:nucleoside-diphosphate-sugar epimerase
MHLFLTGSTGYVGAAVLESFIRAGHSVTALVRNKNRGKQVAARGARPVVGNLGDGSSWHDAALGHDAWVHTALDAPARIVESDRAAIDTLLSAARARQDATPGVLVYTSVIWVLGPTSKPADESAAVNPVAVSAWRAPHEIRVLEAAGPALRTAVVRPGVVYGGSRGIVGDLFRDGANSLIRVVGDGRNRWPLIYVRDLADLYLRIVTTAGASGVFHANDEGDERVADIVETIARLSKTQADVRNIPIDEARAKMGAYADALALDQVVRSPRSRALGWTPSLRSVAGNVPRLMEEWRRGQES